MKFIILEIKGKDLYVIYDTVNLGVCCCSAYTIKQLLEKYSVLGVSFVNDRLRVQEMNLDGTIRSKKAPNCCEDTTKRSAVTIEKGLTEKYYPRVKQNREGMKGLYKPKDTFLYTASDAKEPLYAMMLETGAMLLETGGLLTPENVNKCSNCFKKVELHPRVQEAFQQPYNAYIKYSDLQTKVAELTKEMEKLKVSMQTVKTTFDNDLRNLRVAINEEKRDQKVAEYEKTITGTECPKMSFYNGTLNRELAMTIIKKSERPCRYTYGLKYRKPTTCNVSISKDKALKIAATESLLDIQFEKDFIDLNAYSANDMY